MTLQQRGSRSGTDIDRRRLGPGRAAAVVEGVVAAALLVVIIAGLVSVLTIGVIRLVLRLFE